MNDEEYCRFNIVILKFIFLKFFEEREEILKIESLNEYRFRMFLFLVF